MNRNRKKKNNKNNYIKPRATTRTRTTKAYRRTKIFITITTRTIKKTRRTVLKTTTTGVND